ncbi:methyl-accepting chemotaxis protein [Pseudoneobacillus sp. C159]
MKRSIITRLSWLIALVTLISLSVISFTNYQITYSNVKKAAGIELIGCANITTGLLTELEINQLNNLTSNQAEELGRKISWTIEHKPIFENQYILSLDGKIIVVDTFSQNQGIEVGDTYKVDSKILKKIQEEKQPIFSDVYKFKGLERMTGYAPIFENHDQHGEVVAISAIDFDAKILSERTWSMVSSTIVVGILSLLLTGTIIILYVRKTILPLRELTSYTETIANGDLTIKPEKLKARGEIQLLNDNFNKMVTNLKQALIQTSFTSRELAASSEELSVSTIEVTKIGDKVAQTFKEVAEHSLNQTRDAEKISDVFQHITNQTKIITNQVQSTSTESFEVSTKANQGNSIIIDSMEEMNNIHDSTNNIFQTMTMLQERVNRVNDILTIIKNIASQTNLLALNASIESARAGEHGKGFSVVANEIRKLAEATSQSVESVNSILLEMEQKTSEALELTKIGKDTVDIGIEKVKLAGKAFNEIKEYTQKVSGDVSQIHSTITNIQEEIENANEQIERITSVSREISMQMEQVAIASEHQNLSMAETTASIQMLVQLAYEMERRSNQFNIEEE